MDGKTEDAETKSTLISRNITVLGKRTSVRLEPEMWTALKEIAKREKCKIHDICSLIMLRKNAKTSLTAAIRVFLMLYYRAASTEMGHRAAGHGNFNDMIARARISRVMLNACHDSQKGDLTAIDTNAEDNQADGLKTYMRDTGASCNNNNVLPSGSAARL